jgi:hypothetical protein
MPMPFYRSNVREVLGPLKKKLEGIKPNVLDKLTRTIAADLVSSNMSRIHNEGKAVNGSDIGDYIDGPYKKKREKRQKRVDKVNLDFSGKLHKEFSLEANSQGIGVGFTSEYGANLQEVLEEKYNKTIWGVTREDESVAEKESIKAINKYLNG